MRPTLVLPLALLFACGTEPEPQPEPTGPLDVRSLSFPAHWLVQQVGGEHVQLRSILPVGEDAPHWRPGAELIAGLADADLLVANGAGFEAWTATATLPGDKLIRTAAGVELIKMGSTTHSHGADGSHSHGVTDPHTWGAPSVYAQQARALAAALGQADPEHAAAYIQAADALTVELQGLTTGYTDALGRAGDTKLASNQPAYNYLAREAGIEIHAFDFDPAKAPGEEAVSAFSTWAGDAEGPVLLWEAVPTSEVKAAFPDGVRHVWLDPLEQPAAGGDYDYLAQARANVRVFAELFPAQALEANKTPGQKPPTPGAPASAKPGPRKMKEKGIKGKR